MDFKDYYSTLGVAKTATEKEVKQAFRRLARKHHPDMNPGDKGAENRIKELNEAYEVLGDADKRKKYDELGANWRAYEQAGAGAPGGAPDAAWNINFGGGQGGPGGPGGPGGGGFRNMTEEDMRGMFGDADPFSDFFHAFFGSAAGQPGGDGGRRARGRGRAPRQGQDVEQVLELALEDAFRGAMRRLSITHDGQARTVDVRIPSGVGDGSRVRIPGEGEMGSGGAKSGDLFLRIRLAPHPTFERRGRDLYTHVTLSLTTAVLGGEVDVPTLGSKPLRLKVPPTTQNAQVFRLKGHGMPPVGKSAEPGDLYATADVELPKALTAEQREHFEALKKLEGAAHTPA